MEYWGARHCLSYGRAVGYNFSPTWNQILTANTSCRGVQTHSRVA